MPPDGAGDSGQPGGSGSPSVHDQQTVTSIPGTGTPPSPGAQAWARPVAPPGASASGNAFVGPGGTPPNPAGNSFGAPGGSRGEPVPPPPTSPEGPGQVPYGYGYGYQGQPYYPATPGGAPGYGWPGIPMAPSNGMGTTGLVLGIISAVGFCLWPLAIVLGILAVIFGAIGRGKARRGEATNAGHALAGIICGAAGIALGVTMFVLVILAPDLLSDSETDYSNPGDDGFNTSFVASR
ncbi:DUF4190 domain-containing protein [Streptomyces xiangluensis]|uniref:DUF4190 domain-containing protein n=1 Tax=Streptomyces xiangluensis TaxID=2665720 RepID=A0ABV8YWZ4_9ACTN